MPNHQCSIIEREQSGLRRRELNRPRQERDKFGFYINRTKLFNCVTNNVI